MFINTKKNENQHYPKFIVIYVFKMVLTEKNSHTRRFALQGVFLVANAFIWYFLALNVLYSLVNSISTPLEAQLIYGVHFGTLVICLVVGAPAGRKIGRKKLFTLWTLLGVVSPVVLFAVNSASFPVLLTLAALFAVSAGLGMPNCMEYFTHSTSTANRGRYAGLILLFSGLGLFALRLAGEGVELAIVELIIWRFLGFIAMLRIKPFNEHVEKTTKISYGSLIRQRSFLLYIIPWAMFSIVNYLSAPVQVGILGGETFTFLQIIENAVSGVSAIAAGFLIDYVGRKTASIAGFALLGVSYAILGLYPTQMLSWYLYVVFDGITWGILGVLFVVTIWGELNPSVASDKYYAIGILPFFMSKFVELIFAGSISANIPAYTLFSFTAFFLFLAVLPLVYAPETLPEKITKDRDLKSYIAKAQQVVAKESKKKSNQNKQNQNVEKEQQEAGSDENSEEYKKAAELAEKYY